MPAADHVCPTTTPSTAQIFEDAVYVAEALLLPGKETEGDLEAHLLAVAHEAGLKDAESVLHPKDIQQSTKLECSPTVRGDMQAPLRANAQDLHHIGTSVSPNHSMRQVCSLPQSPTLLHAPFPSPRPSHSSDYDKSPSQSFSIGMQHAQSVPNFSLPNVSSRSNRKLEHNKTTRSHKQRASIFARWKRDLSSFPSRSLGTRSAGSQAPRHDRDHTLRAQSYNEYEERDHVFDYSGPTSPRDVLPLVLIKDDLDSMTNSALQSLDGLSLRDSGYSEDGRSSYDRSYTMDGKSTSVYNRRPSKDSEYEDESMLKLAAADLDYQKLRREQREELKRLSVFESNQHKALAAHYREILERLDDAFAADQIAKLERHPQDMERLDEFQIAAEHELRKVHANEVQNAATAMKYMEAYCSGLDPTDARLTHVVTDDDRKKLERQRLIQQRLPAKHDSAINVLRAKQERDTLLRLQKHQAELDVLVINLEKNRLAQEKQYASTLTRLDDIVRLRRRRASRRWDLRFKTWSVQWEQRYDVQLRGRLPSEDWSEEADTEAQTSPSSTLSLWNEVR